MSRHFIQRQPPCVPIARYSLAYNRLKDREEMMETMPAEADDHTMSTKRRIVEAATRLFAETGYLGTGVRAIEDAVGIQRGALYYHIGSKENLLYEISRGMIVDMNARAAEIVEGHERPQDKLRAIAHLLLQGIVENQLGTTVFFRDWTWLEGAHREEVMAIRDAFEDHVARILAEGIQAGVWADRGPLVVKGVLGMLNYTYVWFRPDGRVSADEVADTFADILLSGLGPGQASAEPLPATTSGAR